ncbi:MAG TPA: glycosyltransferase family 61 protein [Chryseolinea sp.]|nr:glycosyltransferase family 61 protein [Chryseolinea sp.]
MYRYLVLILKAIFPRVFLKNSFLTYNKLKIRTWDRVFFKAQSIGQHEFESFEEKNPFLELQIDIGSFPKLVQQGLKLWTDPNWKQDQYLIVYRGPAYIEPKVGWGVTQSRRLIYPSLGFSRAPYVHKPSWIQAYIKKNKVVLLGNVVSLRDTGEENYFHFFNDVISKLLFLQERNFELSKYVIVISDKLWDKAYFQYYLNNTFIGSLKWHIQKDEWVHFESAVFCKPYTHSVRFLTRSASLVNPLRKGERERKVFLTRHARTSRSLSNCDEIYDVVRKFGFEVVDASELPFNEQVELFANTRSLIAIHGAGLINMIFRGGMPLDLLEILPSETYIPFHYIMIAKVYGYSYDVILGSRLSGDSTFRVNPSDVLGFLNRISP